MRLLSVGIRSIYCNKVIGFAQTAKPPCYTQAQCGVIVCVRYVRRYNLGKDIVLKKDASWHTLCYNNSVTELKAKLTEFVS